MPARCLGEMRLNLVTGWPQATGIAPHLSATQGYRPVLAMGACKLRLSFANLVGLM